MRSVQISEERYVELKGQRCIYCNGDALWGFGMGRSDTYVTQQISCSGCMNTWHDQYKLCGYEVDTCPYPLTDKKISSSELEEACQDKGQTEHSYYTIAKWRQAVSKDYSLLGYWDWVFTKIHSDSWQ
ncbi:hypothetical protein ACFQDN_22210 [Pseudomonas asuensis]|uniref:Uncharacterized protein n=1 Tax=Pseudomonas asuensis TaxID=1825787 RepID=A0ABQ2H2N2_9PSED|nr:hypothetical protein [Pseudomonas asuensis]GGM25934.1 hypothetical protein GCM10009425_40830 [Pseudomonas asuensis]